MTENQGPTTDTPPPATPRVVKYPDVHVQLTGQDGNAMSIMAAVSRGLRRGGAPATDIDAFMAEAMSGDYDNVLRTAMRWVEVG